MTHKILACTVHFYSTLLYIEDGDIDLTRWCSRYANLPFTNTLQLYMFKIITLLY